MNKKKDVLFTKLAEEGIKKNELIEKLLQKKINGGSMKQGQSCATTLMEEKFFNLK